ncbi:response regulator transcription factor [Butyrivibrio sp. VCD2006]|uniref:response regulator transcription factor n=1 Tax=Butyrivibrio sp. VCD2006 TaxID=1280664 RepID=UPI0003F63160|nr:response regulator transcription factor [Butyrivibrio sp. VCD2006]
MNDKKYKILIAEDDVDIIALLRLYLENAGYDVISATDGRQALTLLETDEPSLFICDIMMPKMNGYEVIKSIRDNNNNIPILVLSAKNLDSDRILGLNIGADDYMVKPFNPLEIVARANSLLRRFYQLGSGDVPAGAVYTIGELTLDVEKARLMKNGREILITPTEFKILTLLMKNPGRVFTKVQIYEYINGEYYESDDNTLMVHMSKLRDKIEDDSKNPGYIKTVRGLGYKMERNI